MLETYESRFVKLPYGTFMDELVAAPPSESQDGPARPDYAHVFDAIPARRCPTEVTLLHKFTDCIDNAEICPDHSLVTVSVEPSTVHKRCHEVEAALVSERDAQGTAVERDLRTILPVIFLRDAHKGESEDPMEADPSSSASGAEETDPKYENESRRRSRERLMEIVEDMFRSQHRTHVFSVAIFGTCARLFLWDRSGAAYTDKFDYRKNPELLCEFFYRVARMSSAAQGFDSSVTVLEQDSETADLMRAVADRELRYGDYARQLFKSSLDDHYVWCKVRVDDEPSVQPPGSPTASASASASHKGDAYPAMSRYGPALTPSSGDSSEEENEVLSSVLPARRAPVAPSPKYYLVGAPCYYVRELHGRGIRGYVALDPTTENFVFLKDAWLPTGIVEPSMVSTCEGEVLRQLNSAGVQNVPTLLCHGYVKEGEAQQTRTTGLCDAPGADIMEDPGLVHTSRHYRLAIAEVGAPFDTARSGYELASAVNDCLVAHQQAYEQLDILHRDISTANIILVDRSEYEDTARPARRGILIDWEMAYYTNKAADADENMRYWHNMRMGTSTFFSAFMSSTRYKVHKIQDDMESFFQLLFYSSLHILPNTCQNVSRFSLYYFHKLYAHALRRNPKYAIIKNNQLYEWPDPAEKIFFGLDARTYPLNELFSQWIEWFQAYYEVMLCDHPLIADKPTYPRPPTPDWCQGVEIDEGGPPHSPPHSPTSVEVHCSDDPVHEEAEVAEAEPVPVAPETRELAALLGSHQALRALFHEILSSAYWPKEDDAVCYDGSEGSLEEEPLIATERTELAVVMAAAEEPEVEENPKGRRKVRVVAKNKVAAVERKPAPAERAHEAEEKTTGTPAKGKKAAAARKTKASATKDAKGNDAKGNDAKANDAKGKKVAATKGKSRKSKNAPKQEAQPVPPAETSAAAAKRSRSSAQNRQAEEPAEEVSEDVPPAEPPRSSGRKRKAAEPVEEVSDSEDAPIAKRLRALPHRLARASSGGDAGPPRNAPAEDRAALRRGRSGAGKKSGGRGQ